jgi:pyridoxal phosphate enzyme (YggS family)
VTVLHGPPDRTADPEELRHRREVVGGRVAAACRRVGRSPAAVTIVAVTKTHPPEVARAAVAAGLTDLAESHVQELLRKMRAVDHARWHLVGRLQRNKARDVVGRAVLVHALDRRSLADELSKRARRAGSVQRTLVQVNVGDDPAKGGCPPQQALDLIAYARDLPAVAVEGLTTIPPLPPREADPGEVARPHFARLRRLRDRARAEWPEVTHLSMGMSADFEVAVEEGATIVRLGTVMFGPRRDPAPAR